MALEDLMEFPCNYTIKVLGSSEQDFPDLVAATISGFAENVSDPDVRASSAGRFVSVNVSFMATGVPQLEAIHQALNATGKVKYII